jgi:phosphoglycerate dehydrogenase-like enzyme
MASAIGYRVVAFDPALTDEAIIAAGAAPADLQNVIAQANVLSLHVPITPETENLIDAAAIATMPPGAVLINVSRGGLVDEDALAEALRTGRLAGAGIDAYLGDPAPLREGHPLLGLEEVVLTPHSAHYSEEAFKEAKVKALLDVRRVLRGERPAYPVNEIATSPISR